MVEAMRGAALVAAIVTMGMLAGVFYSFAISVMPGLAHADARTLVDAMQQINVAILNPWFLISFVGAPLFSLIAAALHLGPGGRPALWWVVAAFTLCVVTLVVTIAVNVPLNDTLAAAGAPDRIADLAAVRDRFEATWVHWNVVRTVTSTAAFGCLAWALALHGRP
ncbi:MAG: DUF1772 domain-containing protein [Pseudonocardiales bacterium]|nr:MAG: DUF1772 domain-containing protein [Pseudonocardiales bacterium]